MTTSPTADRYAGTAIAASILDLIGDTPLVALPRFSAGLPTEIVAKLETTNPGGSSKDRPALAMIEAAEAEGLLQPGGTIVEPTSGNTGVGLAIVAAQRGYRCVFVMTDKVAPEKVSLLRAYGAEVIVCPNAVAPEDPRSYYSTAQRLSEEIPGAFRPNQYANPANPRAHYDTTGPEIWEQTAGRVTHVVVGAGTGGTISGIGRYLKEHNPAIRIVAADPEASVYSGGDGRPYLVEGVGEDFWPSTYDPSVIDDVVAISDAESFATAREIARTEGVLVGGSGGLALAAARRVAASAGPDALVVVVIPDSGRGYLSKVFDDTWMANHGFFERADVLTAGDILAGRGTDVPSLLTVHGSSPVAEAAALMARYGISQVLVSTQTPIVAAAQIIGLLDEQALLRAQTGSPDATCDAVMGPKPAYVGANESVDALVAALDRSACAVVFDAGVPAGVLTRADVLTHLNYHPRTIAQGDPR